MNVREDVDINQVRAIIFHSGSARYGHYTSLRKINDDEYLYISDSNVRRLNPTEAQKILTDYARNIKMTLLDAGGSTTTAETAEDGTGAATTPPSERVDKGAAPKKPRVRFSDDLEHVREFSKYDPPSTVSSTPVAPDTAQSSALINDRIKINTMLDELQNKHNLEIKRVILKYSGKKHTLRFLKKEINDPAIGFPQDNTTKWEHDKNIIYLNVSLTKEQLKNLFTNQEDQDLIDKMKKDDDYANELTMNETAKYNVRCIDDGKYELNFIIQNTRDNDGNRSLKMNVELLQQLHAALSSTPVAPNNAQSTSTVSDETQQQSVFNPPKVEVTKVVEKNNRYSAIFRSSKNKNTEPMASANAGDTGLYVGGAGINHQFGIEVNNNDSFEAFHTAVIGGSTPTYPSSVEYYHHVAPPNGCKSTEGHIIISGFKDEECPHKNTANRAMVYIVPPKWSSFNNDNRDKEFYDAVQQVSENTIKAISEYNAGVPDENKKIKTFRPVAFSSNSKSYVGRADPKTVKQHILAGIQAGLSKYTSSGITKIELPNAFDDVRST